MENIAKIQRKIQEVLEKMQSSPNINSNVKPGNIESLIKSSKNVEQGQNDEAANEISSIIQQLQDYAMQLAKEHKHETVTSKYDKEPKKYEGPSRGKTEN